MIRYSATAPAEYTGDLLVYMVRQSAQGGLECTDRAVQRIVEGAHGVGDFSGREGESLLCYPPPLSGKKTAPRRFLVLGLGNKPLNREIFRKAGGLAASLAMKGKSREMLIVLPVEAGFDPAVMAESVSEGVVLGAYRFRKYKTREEEDAPAGLLREAALYAADAKKIRPAVKIGGIMARAACVARDMVNEPGSHWTPDHFAGYGKELAAKHAAIQCTILDKARMRRLGMGGMLGVAQGSAQPPRMVILEYRVKRRAPTLLLVGKGLTFDSGGISIKPGQGMEEMKYDMAGGAAVLGAVQAVAEAGLQTMNIVAVIPAAENLPGPAALKPGDLIVQYGGRTVEVVNTDAEGRLLLADALAYGREKYKPDLVVDVATLTGAVIISLGHHHTGLFSNNDELSAGLLAAGERCGEPLWRLPLGVEYTKHLKSEIADLKNVGPREGGAVSAAAFLQEFVGDTPWAHLDIAGTAWNFTEKSYIPKGPSGIAARTLFDFIRNWKK